MQTSQGRDRHHAAAQWHYTDAAQRRYGPYAADAIARLFQFGHIRADTRLWRADDAAGARPLREHRDAFRIEPDGRIRVIAPPAVAPPPDRIPDPVPATAPESASQPPPAAASGTSANDIGDGQAGPTAAPPRASASAGAHHRWLRVALIAALALAGAAVALRLFA